MMPDQTTRRALSRTAGFTGRRILREDIRDQLIGEILSGQLAPGDRIVETRIARQFGVSQAPVREALRDLEMFGFIVSAPFKGALVRKITVNELVQVYPVRAVIEGLAARDATLRLDEKGFQHLEQLLVTLCEDAERGEARATVEGDFAFHLAIVEASGNWLLKQFWERMQLATTTFITVLQSHRSLVEIAGRHTLVLDALRARDPDVAERVMRQHIEEPGQWIREAAEARASQPPVTQPE
jgi:DNA-binding GntR family transcriptional regulator